MAAEGSTNCKYIRDQSLAEEAEDALRRAASEVDGVLTMPAYRSWREAQDDTHPSHHQIVRELGDRWSEVCAERGIPTHTCQYDIDQIITAMQTAADAVGEPLTIAAYEEWRQHGHSTTPTPSYTTIARKLKWSKAGDKAGVEVGSQRPDTIDREEMIAAMQRAVEAVGEPLTTTKYSTWRQRVEADVPAAGTITMNLGWKVACRDAGIEHGDKSYDFDTPDITAAVREAAESVGEPISVAEYQQWRKVVDANTPSVYAVANELGDGSWCAACRAADVTPAGTCRGGT